MTSILEHHIAALAKAARELNEASDLMNEQANRIQVALGKFGLGVEAWITIQPEGGEHPLEVVFGYAKLEEGWVLAIREGDNGWPFHGAPRRLRMLCYSEENLKRLLAALSQEVSIMADRISQAADRFNDYLKGGNR